MQRGIRYRVYFNKIEGPKGKAWTVDTGEGTKRQHFAAVAIDALTSSVYTGKKSDGKNPVAWFAVTGVLTIHTRLAPRIATILRGQP